MTVLFLDLRSVDSCGMGQCPSVTRQAAISREIIVKGGLAMARADDEGKDDEGKDDEDEVETLTVVTVDLAVESDKEAR